MFLERQIWDNWHETKLVTHLLWVSPSHFYESNSHLILSFGLFHWKEDVQFDVLFLKAFLVSFEILSCFFKEQKCLSYSALFFSNVQIHLALW